MHALCTKNAHLLCQSWKGGFNLRNFFIQQVLTPGKVYLLKVTLASNKQVSMFLLLHVFSPDRSNHKLL